MSIHEAIQRFRDAYGVISEYFGGDLEISPALMLDEHWYLVGQTGQQEIRFANMADFNPKDPDCFQYTMTIYHKSIWVKEEFTAARIHDDCGNNYCVILANKNKHDIDEWE